MSINLVDLIMKQVGGNLPGVLGSLLGESADRTQGAIAGAVPAILGSLMGVASKGGSGAEQLVSAVRDQDDSLLDNLAGMLGGGNHQAIADQGSSMLSSLLGDGVIGSLVGAVGKFSGLGGGSTKSLLGLLAPIVMSVLSKQQKAEGLDGGGLLGLLSSQKDNIEQAMPSGMASALSGAGLLDSIMGTAQSATESIGEAVDTAAGAAGRAAGAAATAAGQTAESVSRGASNVAAHAGAAASEAASTGGSWLRWALPLIVLLALVWLAFKFLGGSDVEEVAGDASDAAGAAVEATTEAASDAASAAGDAASSAVDATTEAASDAASAAGDAAGSAAEAVTAMVGDIDVGGELTSMFDGMSQTLSGITDLESAEAAIPALEEMSTNLDSLTDLADQLPEGAVSGISEMVSSSLGDIDAVMESLKSIPGVGDLIEPIIATIKEKLAAFTTA